MVLGFLREAAGLKRVMRQGWIDRLGMGRPESVADHTYGVAVIAMVLADSRGLDAGRAVRMALLHDLAESRTGDLVPGQAGAEEKRAMEDEAFCGIVRGLPGGLAAEYAGLWREYSEGATPEAALVRQADKLEMALQASEYAGDGHPRELLAPFLDDARGRITDPELKEIFTELVNGMHGRGGERRAGRGPEGGHQDTLRGGAAPPGKQRP